jgi:hypothetical protein
MRLPIPRKHRPGPVARVRAGIDSARQSVGAALFVAVLALVGVLILAVTR